MIQETIRTIAARTGVSVSTVSRVLTGKGDQYRIAQNTQKLILDEAERCHYAPSLVARALRTKSTKTIGLIVPAISNPFFWTLAGIISQQAKAKGYVVLLMDSTGDPEMEKDGLLALKSHKVDGILMIPSADDPKVIEDAAAEIPLILLDRYYAQSALPYVSSQNEQGAYEGTRFLLNKGHRKIAFIQGPSHVITSSERVKGFQRAMREEPQAEAIIVGDDFSVENGCQSAMELTEGPLEQRPTAIFAGNNTILFGILKAFHHTRPIDYTIDLLCFDNPDYMQFFPFVYRIGQNIEQMGQKALQMLIRKIEAQQKQQEGNIPSLLLPVDLSLLKD